MKIIYMAVSLPPDFSLDASLPRTRIMQECVLPVCLKLNLPFAMMIGVKRGVNPNLGEAGDATGKANIDVLHTLCAKYPKNKFMATLLSKENQHELCITARKFRNLMIFGCWWFINNRSLMEEVTRMRIENLGLSFVLQHSDARCFDQLIYKWSHSKEVIVKVLTDKYSSIMDSGWRITVDDIRHDARAIFSKSFKDFLELSI